MKGRKNKRLCSNIKLKPHFLAFSSYININKKLARYSSKNVSSKSKILKLGSLFVIKFIFFTVLCHLTTIWGLCFTSPCPEHQKLICHQCFCSIEPFLLARKQFASRIAKCKAELIQTKQSSMCFTFYNVLQHVEFATGGGSFCSSVEI